MKDRGEHNILLILFFISYADLMCICQDTKKIPEFYFLNHIPFCARICVCVSL